MFDMLKKHYAIRLIVVFITCSVLMCSFALTTSPHAAHASTCLDTHPAVTNNGNNTYPASWRDGTLGEYTDCWDMSTDYCTSWVAWELHYANGFELPWGFGNASDWASNAQASAYPVNATPGIGSVAQWNAASWNGQLGHVAWVKSINSSSSITVEEYNFSNPGAWDQRTITTGGTGSLSWPSNFIHFADIQASSQPSTPVAVSRASTNMAVFYNDGNSHLVNWSWDQTNGWFVQQWTANFSGDTISGQPAVISRTSDSMDVFYRTHNGKLVNMGWNATSGWNGPTILLTSGVAGDPAAIARDSSDMQVFFLTSAGQIESIAWNATTGWNTSLQDLYTNSATGDPTALSRSSNSMDIFFGKNNGNLVHLSWTATNGWQTEDFSAGAGVTARPSCIVRNSGNDMSCYYQENGNGKVAEEFWNSTNGWGWQDWTASLAGEPSAIPGVNNTIDDFYRETGGNIVDRYFGPCGWCTMNIVGAGSATGNPFALMRDSNIEVFYWTSGTLMDANWNTSSNTWNTAPVQ